MTHDARTRTLTTMFSPTVHRLFWRRYSLNKLWSKQTPQLVQFLRIYHHCVETCRGCPETSNCVYHNKAIIEPELKVTWTNDDWSDGGNFHGNVLFQMLNSIGDTGTASKLGGFSQLQRFSWKTSAAFGVVLSDSGGWIQDTGVLFAFWSDV